MLVYFLRHAEAEPDAGRDFDRKLTPKGLDQAEKAAKFLAKQGLMPARVLASPVARARRTAEIVCARLDAGPPVLANWLACGMKPLTCLRELSTLGGLDSVLLVGHEPDFGETIGEMLGATGSDAIKVRKASLTAVDLPRIEPGAGVLQFLVPVRLM